MFKTFCFICFLVVVGSQHAFGVGSGTFADPFESEVTDPNGDTLHVVRCQSVVNDPPIVVGDMTYGSYQVRQFEFSHVTVQWQGVPIEIHFRGKWNEHTSSSRIKTDAAGNEDRVKDYLRSDLATVASFPMEENGNRYDDGWKWVRNHVESTMDLNTAQTIGQIIANAYVDDPSTVDSFKAEDCCYAFSFDKSGPGAGSWDMSWSCDSLVDQFCGGQSGDWFQMPGFLGTIIDQKQVGNGLATNRLKWAFSNYPDDAWDMRKAATDHPAPIPAVAITPWTQTQLLRPAEFD